jgi:hypothetical protein
MLLLPIGGRLEDIPFTLEIVLVAYAEDADVFGAVDGVVVTLPSPPTVTNAPFFLRCVTPFLAF